MQFLTASFAEGFVWATWSHGTDVFSCRECLLVYSVILVPQTVLCLPDSPRPVPLTVNPRALPPLRDHLSFPSARSRGTVA